MRSIFAFSALAPYGGGVGCGGLLGLIITERVVLFTAKIIGQVLLLHVVIRVIVRIAVSLKKGRLQVPWHGGAKALFYILACGGERQIRGIGFGGGGQKDRRIDEGDAGLGQTQFLGTFTAGAHHGGRLGPSAN